jgi:hypothetical protein
MGQGGRPVTKIVVKSYGQIKDEIDDYCRKHQCGYEIYPSGKAVIIVD